MVNLEIYLTDWLLRSISVPNRKLLMSERRVWVESDITCDWRDAFLVRKYFSHTSGGHKNTKQPKQTRGRMKFVKRKIFLEYFFEAYDDRDFVRNYEIQKLNYSLHSFFGTVAQYPWICKLKSERS